MSEWYLRDLSRKQRAAVRVKGESGKPITNQVIYGYKKAPNDKYHWLVEKENIDRPYTWSDFIVGRILSKPEHMDHTVNFRSHKESYKDKQPIFHNPEDWLIFEDAYGAIGDKDTWELVQKLRGTPRRIDTLGEANPLTGLVFCADCGLQNSALGRLAAKILLQCLQAFS